MTKVEYWLTILFVQVYMAKDNSFSIRLGLAQTYFNMNKVSSIILCFGLVQK